MDDEHDIENIESNSESDTENPQTEVEPQTIVVSETDYSAQLQQMYEVQQIGVGLCCVIIGLLLVDIIFNILKRFF